MSTTEKEPLKENPPLEWALDMNITIEDMMECKIDLQDLIETQGAKMPISWLKVMGLINLKSMNGKKLTPKSPVKDAIKAYYQIFPAFFGK